MRTAAITSWLLFFATHIFAQKIDNTSTIDTIDVISGNFSQKDTLYWAYNFQLLQNILLCKDKQKAEHFFILPLTDKPNEIWYLVLEDTEKAHKKINSNFTRDDFYKFFDKIFTLNFIESLQKINVEQLYEEGKYTTSTIKKGNKHYVSYINYYPSEKILEINFATKRKSKDENGDIYIETEFNIIYYFKITKKGYIIFEKIKLAG